LGCTADGAEGGCCLNPHALIGIREGRDERRDGVARAGADAPQRFRGEATDVSPLIV
jgi:hypothetical protein